MGGLSGILLAGVIALFCYQPATSHRVISHRAKCLNGSIYDYNYRFRTLQNHTEVSLSQYRGTKTTNLMCEGVLKSFFEWPEIRIKEF